MKIHKKKYKNTAQKKHSKYKYTFYQNTHTLQNKFKQPQNKTRNEIVTIQSSTLSIRSP